MSTTWLDSSEQEYETYGDSGEEHGESGEDYGEASAAERRRRRRIALARRQEAERARTRAAAAGQGRPAPATTQQRTAAAIRSLDLESKVAEDSLRSGVAALQRQAARNNWVTALGVLVTAGIEAFDGPDNPYLRNLLRGAPLAVMEVPRRETGFQSVASDPRIVSAAALLGITFLGQNRERFSSRSHHVSVQSPSTLAPGESDVFIADVRDRFGARAKVPIRWSTDKPTVATIDPDTGAVTAGEPGVARITLTVDNDPHDYRLRVDAPAGQAAGPDRTLAVQKESDQQKKR